MPRRHLLPVGLPRRPGPYWIGVVALTVLTVGVVGRLTADAADAADRWGSTELTLVAQVDLTPGQRLGPGDTDLVALPIAVVPDSALHGAVDGQVVTTPISRGEIVVSGRVGSAGSALAALVADSERGIAVPASDASLPVEVGDVVDVLATFDPTEGGDTPTVAVAEAARVIGIGEGVVTLSVVEDDAARVAYALSAGIVTLALRGSG